MNVLDSYKCVQVKIQHDRNVYVKSNYIVVYLFNKNLESIVNFLLDNEKGFSLSHVAYEVINYEKPLVLVFY
jgi:hypothetical protein